MRHGAAEQGGDGAMVERVSGRGGYLAVGGDFAGWNGEDDAAEGGVAGLVGAEGGFEEGAGEVLGNWLRVHRGFERFGMEVGLGEEERSRFPPGMTINRE